MSGERKAEDQVAIPVQSVKEIDKCVKRRLESVLIHYVMKV